MPLLLVLAIIVVLVPLMLLMLSIDSPCYEVWGRLDSSWFFTSGKAWMNGMTPYVDFADSKGPLLWLMNHTEMRLANLIGHGDVAAWSLRQVREFCEKAGLRVEKLERGRKFRLHLIAHNPIRSFIQYLFHSDETAVEQGIVVVVAIKDIAVGIGTEISRCVIIIDDEGERSSLDQGLSTAAQLGVNANTSRLRDVETTVSANYKYTDTDSGTMAERTTYQEGGNLLASTQDFGKQFVHALNTNLELKKEKGKVWFHFSPSFRFNKIDETGSGSSETLRAGTFVNGSENASRRLSVRAENGRGAGYSLHALSL